MEERPLITPAQFLSVEGVTAEDNDCTVAVIAFCPFHAMRERACARRLDKPLFVHLDPAHQFRADVHGRPILMADCVYGGPVCATVIEEMAYLGIRYVIGYGYSGSVRPDIPPGAIALASSAIVSDGTSHEYVELSEVRPSAILMRVYNSLDPEWREGVHLSRVWTTDAIYHEVPSKVQSWRHRGADLVNMDTTPLYAVSQAVGIASLYLSLVSDYVGGEEWYQQFLDVAESRNRLHGIVLELAAACQQIAGDSIGPIV